MIYPVVKYGNAVLEKPGETVTRFDDELRKLVEDMFESMYAAHGVGLAAPQIGISKRLAVIDVSFKEDPKARLVLVNPEIIRTEGKQRGSEGCLSLPEFREEVTRPMRVTVRAQDATGKHFEASGEELLARALMHEGARQQFFACSLEVLAVGVLGAHGNALGTRDLFPELGKAQAAFAAALFPLDADDHGVYQHQFCLGVFFERDIDDGETLRDADLRRRQAYAVRRVHGLEHVLDQLAQLFIEDGDDFRRFLQNRVAIFDDGIDHQEQLSVASCQLYVRIIRNP